jgi:RimJ/RimL family protein N-acetyltransferase
MSSQTRSSKNINSTLEKIALINKECFTSDDYYSNIDNLTSLVMQGAKILVVRDKGKFAGYIIYTEFENHLESLRRALTKSARGKGLGVRLARKLIKIADEQGKDIYTYVAKTNLPSLNSNIKCGYRVENIDEDWVYIRYKGKRNGK